MPPEAGLRRLQPGTLAVLAAFVVSRIAYWLAGVRYDATPVSQYWQNISIGLMKTDLLRSLFYLHMQPPGFDLGLGIVVKLFPDSYPAALQAIYLVLGVAISLCLLHLMRLLGVSDLLAAGLTILLMASPGCVMYENLASYEYPILLLLLLAAIALYRLCEAPSLRRSLMFFGLLFGLTMIRNIFHILFVVLIAAALALILPRSRRIIVLGALPAIVLILALQTKNWILFNSFTTSSWMGMNTATTTTYQLTPEETERLIQQGVVTPLARIPPFKWLPTYADFVQPAPATGIPVLDEVGTYTHPNFNNPSYLPLHKMFLANSKGVWLHYPQAYLRAVAIAWFTYFLPPTDYEAFDTKRAIIEPVDRIYSAVVFGQFKRAPSRKDLRDIKATEGTLALLPYGGMFAMIWVTALLVWALRRLLSRKRRSGTVEQQTVLGFMVATILFCTLVSNFLATFENNRYRFPLDGYYTVVAGLAISSMVRTRHEIEGQP